MATGASDEGNARKVGAPHPGRAAGPTTLSSLTLADWLVLGGAVAYFVALLLPWVSLALVGLPELGRTANGLGQLLAVLGWLALVAAAVWLLLPVSGVTLPSPSARHLVTVSLGAAALVLTVAKIVDVATSDRDFGGQDVAASPGAGAYLGLLAALAAVAGALLLLRGDRTNTAR